MHNFICCRISYVAEFHMLQNFICCRISFVAEFYLLQNFICCRISSVAEFYLLQNFICCRILSVAEFHLLHSCICFKIIALAAMRHILLQWGIYFIVVMYLRFINASNIMSHSRVYIAYCKIAWFLLCHKEALLRGCICCRGVYDEV